MKHLVLIDGHHLMYRAYWAIPRTLKTRSGEQTNTVFGVASMLLSILAKEEPDAFLFCFDEGDETFRHQEAVDYKAGRAETPDDFYVQIPRVHELIDMFAIPHVSDPKFEADDLLCAYARAAEKDGMRVTIVTGDRDALQLASEHIRVAIPHKGYQQAEYLGPKEIEAKYGVRPDQIASYKGLTGDQSDNLPGVKGIGPKNAAELLQKYDTLQGVYDHLEEIRPAVRAKLENDREQAFFCERMALLISDMPLPITVADLALERFPVEQILTFFRALEFTLLIKRFQSLLASPFGQLHSSPEDLPTPSAPARPGDHAGRTGGEAKAADQLLLFES
ncbi:MAG: 5'-3' exonuclease H3TH domain-containing protein [Candidatus Peregrinibacteria bacterium]